MIPGVVSSAGGLTAPTPTFSAVTSTDTGFYFTISNYDSNFSYAVSTTTGTVVRDGATVTQGGVSYSTSATVTVTASKPGWISKSATRSGTSNAAPPTPPPCVPAGCTPACGTATFATNQGAYGGGPCNGSIICCACPGCQTGCRRWAKDCYIYTQQSCADNCGIVYYRTCDYFCVDSTVSASCCPS